MRNTEIGYIRKLVRVYGEEAVIEAARQKPKDLDPHPLDGTDPIAWVKTWQDIPVYKRRVENIIHIHRLTTVRALRELIRGAGSPPPYHIGAKTAIYIERQLQG